MFNENFEKNKFNFIDGFKTLKAKDYVNFNMYGFVSFVGCQGSGKSLSVHKLMYDLKQAYPDVKIISNVFIPWCEFDWYRSPKQIAESDHLGFILFLDEITNMFSSYDKLPVEWFELINMQRKRELLIITTCPVFSRIPKPFREQFDTICLCKRIGTLQINKYCKVDSDMMNLSETTEDAVKSLRVLRTNFFFHSKADYERYNTKSLIYGGKEKQIGSL